jgi:hypothetical protein
MNKVWMESVGRAATDLFHTPDMPATHSIPRKLCANALIEQPIPELSRSGGSPISYQLS